MSTTININGLAEKLGVTRRTVYNMLRDDRIPVSPIPSLKPLRWNAALIDAWLIAQPTDKADA